MATFEEARRTRATNWNIGLTWRARHDARKEYLSWLRAAYLAAFAALGYTYVARPPLERIREQLRTPDANIVPFLMGTASQAAKTRGMLVAFEPEDLRGIVVAFGSRVLMLPDFTAEEDFYERLAGACQARAGGIQSRGRVIAWPASPRLELDFDRSRLALYYPPGDVERETAG